MALPVQDQKAPHSPHPARHHYHGFKKEKTELVIYLPMAPLARFPQQDSLTGPSSSSEDRFNHAACGGRGVVGAPGPMTVELHVSKGKSQRNEPH